MNRVVAIGAGGRDFYKRDLLPLATEILTDLGVGVLVHGGQRGGDSMWDIAGTAIGSLHRVAVPVSEANWASMSKRAGYARNALVAEIASRLPASKRYALMLPGGVGTRMMEDIVRSGRGGIVFEVIRFDEQLRRIL